MPVAKMFINSLPRTDLIEYQLKLEGERAVDEIPFKLVKTSVSQSGVDIVPYNTQMKIIQDIINIDNLQVFLCYDSHVLDGSGFDTVFTESSTFSYVSGQSTNSKAADFTGTKYMTAPNSTRFNVLNNTKWSIACRIKADLIDDESGVNRTIAGLQDDASNAFVITFRPNGHFYVRFTKGGVSVAEETTTAFVTGTWYDVVVTFDSGTSDLRIYVNGVDQGTTAQANFALTPATSLWIGARSATTGRFDGQFEYFRMYNRILGATEISKLDAISYRLVPVKFGGYVTRINDSTNPIELGAKSYGKVIGEVEINTKIFDNKKASEIIQSLLGTFTTLIWVNNFTETEDVIERYVADGKLIDIIYDLSKSAGAIFHTDGWNRFVYESEILDTSMAEQALARVFTHGTNGVIVAESGYDDSEMVNDLTIVGYEFPYRTTDTFSGDGATTIFTLSHPITSPRVLISGVEKSPDTDYAFDVDKRTITFTVAPPVGASNISVENTFERPVYVRAQNLASIAANKIRSKKLILTWIRSYEDGVVFANAYLSAFANVVRRYKLTIPYPENYIDVNELIKVVNQFLGANTWYQVKSITYKYPTLVTEIIVGEFHFDLVEVQKNIYSKIHNLESAVKGTRDIRDYRTFAQPITLTGVAVINRYDKAEYNNNDTYNSNDVYSSP